MGITVSRMEAERPASTSAPAAPVSPQLSAAVNAVRPKSRTEEVVDYKNLPAPVKYDELGRESQMILKPETFEGLRFDFSRPLNQNFAISHSLFAGNVEVPTNNAQVIKMPMGTYEFGANLISHAGNMMVGRVLTDGRVTGRVKYDLNDWLSTKLQLQMSPDAGMSQSMFDINVKRDHYNAELKVGSTQFYGFNYLQSVTPQLALGGEIFWLAGQRKSGTGFVGRYQGSDCIATAQLASTGLLSLSFTQRISEKVSLSSDFMCNWNAKEATASFGYDYMLRQCRLRGRIDSEGKVAALVEERVTTGVNFLLSAEIDHWKKDYKFGFGLVLGE